MSPRARIRARVRGARGQQSHCLPTRTSHELETRLESPRHSTTRDGEKMSSAAANALTNLARAAVTIGVGASVASQAIYDGACVRATGNSPSFVVEGWGWMIG